MESLGHYIATLVVLLVVALLSKYLGPYLRPKSRLVWWQRGVYVSHDDSEFHEVTVENRGRKNAENIEVVYSDKPEILNVSPALNYEEIKTPSGHYIIKVATLGYNECFTIRCETRRAFWSFERVRSPEGDAERLYLQPWIEDPRWRVYLFRVLCVIGAACSIYWLLRAVTYLYSVFSTKSPPSS